MELKEFPLFSEDLLTLTSQEDLSGVRAGRAIQFQPYGDDWMAVQGDARVIVNCNPADRVLFERLVQRDQVRWLLTTTRKGQLLVQYCAPVEVSIMGLEFGIDGFPTLLYQTGENTRMLAHGYQDANQITSVLDAWLQK
jgi:hypothetical protein